MVFGAAGIDPRNGALFFHLEPTVGGWGAWRGRDGEGSLINNVNCAMKDFPVEILETKTQRDRVAIEEDIANGYLSADAARELYGYEGGAE